MWNLFSTVEPKVIQPAKSLKEELLQHEEKALSSINEELNKIITSINFLLKLNATDPTQTPSSEESLINDLSQIVSSLESHIQTDNSKFQDYITYRDQQKNNQQEFFKTTLRSYETKKSELNRYIEELEDKVQALELKGFKTYELTPKRNSVLSGMNNSYLDKYIQKIDELKKIQKGLQKFVLKNRTKTIKAKNSHSSTEFTHLKDKKHKPVLIETHNKLNSLYDLEKQLESILLKEEVVAQILDTKIRNCKTTFQSLAHQEKTLKQSMKKIGTISQEKKNTTVSNFKSSRGSTQTRNALTTPTLQKTPSSTIKKPEANKENQGNCNDPSIVCEEAEEIESEAVNIDENSIHSSVEENPDEAQVPSQNFIDACQFLITQRFVGDQNEEKEVGEQICDENAN